MLPWLSNPKECLAWLQTNSFCRRPADASAILLYRKVPTTPPKAIVLEAPVFAASEADMDEWLKNYLAALDQVDPDTEGAEPGETLASLAA